MLSQLEVLRSLIDRGLLETVSVVESGVTIADMSRRNRNFRVVVNRGPSYFIKQASGLEDASLLAHEDEVYRLLAVDAGADGKVQYLPRSFGLDAKTGLFVLELLTGAADMREHQRKCGRFSQSLARVAGKTLANLHGKNTVTKQRMSIASAVTTAPWILSLASPSFRVLREISHGNIELIKTLQKAPAAGSILSDLHTRWKHDYFVHGDIKWDNCMVIPKAGSQGRWEIKLVDWETAGLGDPCWDLGSMFGNYLSCWLFSIPYTDKESVSQSVNLARYPLERIQPAMRSLWQAYRTEMALDAQTSNEWLVTSTRFSAARLIQTAYEAMVHSPNLTVNIANLVQLSLNILRRPAEAAVHLLGISLDVANFPESVSDPFTSSH